MADGNPPVAGLTGDSTQAQLSEQTNALLDTSAMHTADATHGAQAATDGAQNSGLGIEHADVSTSAASATSPPSSLVNVVSPSPLSAQSASDPLAEPSAATNANSLTSTSEQEGKMKAQVAELSSQVTSLNNKLVQSYNRVGGLEDDLHSKTTILAELQSKVEKLEAEQKAWEDKYEGGLLVEKDHVQAELSRMMDRVIEETASRGKAENDKAAIERELAELSSQLFDEANQMVAKERMERLRAERKMQALEINLKDTESLMLSQGSQMRDMGGKIDEIEAERDELRKKVEELEEALEHQLNESAISLRSETIEDSEFPPDSQTYPPSSEKGFLAALPSTAIAPGTPGTPGTIQRQLSTYLQAAALAHPLQHLSYDIAPFKEFVLFTRAMARIRKNILTRPPYETTANPYGYGGYATAYGPIHINASAHSQGSSSTSGNGGSAPTRSASGMHTYEQRESLREALPLSQYNHYSFVKRTIDEDTDPVLHLSDAPGLSFFSRRQVSTAIIEGQLHIEPAYVSLPSDHCCLCGRSLEKYITSNQTTQPKDDPKKKFARLATGWIPGSISGTSTPLKEANTPTWSISALSEALQGALTPSKESSGFNFGSSDTNSKTGSSITRKTSTSATDATTTPGEDGKEIQGNFPVIPSARTHAQVYIFRIMDSSSRYALCPTYCLPRMRATCELWTYIRSIQRGLLNEDNPRFFSTPTSSSEYSQRVRKLSSTGPMSASGLRTPSVSTSNLPTPGLTPGLATPGTYQNKQLGLSTLNSGNGAGNDKASSNGSNTNGQPMGLGLDLNAKDYAFDSRKSSSPDSAAKIEESLTVPSITTEASSPGVTSDSINAGNPGVEGLRSEGKDLAPSTEPESKPLSRSTSVDVNSSPNPGSEAKHDSSEPFKLVMPPARPKRNVARVTPSASPVVSKDSPSFAETKGSETPDTPAASTGDSPKMTNAPDAEAAAVSAPTTAPPLPARSATAPLANTSAQGPKLPSRPVPPRLSTSKSSLSVSTIHGGGNALTPTTRRPSIEGGVAVVDTKKPNWQMQCWYEIVRLKEVTFWTRVGSTYDQQ